MSQPVVSSSFASLFSLDKDDYSLNRYKIFVVIWAIASLFHMANHRMFTDELHYFLLSASAIFLFLKPTSILRLLIFMALQLYEVYNTLPVVSNHWIFASFVNITIIHALLYQVVKTKSFQVKRVELLRTFAPIVRIELIILYFFVVFHKLNWGFFTPEVSCASNFYAAQNAYSLLPGSMDVMALNAYLTIFIEALIPLLLIFRRTRDWGLLIGLIFHCVIAYNPLNGFYDFSALVFAVYFLFTSSSFSNKLFGAYKNLVRRKEEVKNRYPEFSFFRLALLVVIFLLVIGLIHVLTQRFSDYFRHVLWTAFSFTFIAVFIIAMFNKQVQPTTKDKAFLVPHLSLLIIPLVVFLNGITPYLGLKTEHSFAMFSNLRTEGGITNHFFVPVETQIFDYQKDLVEVTASSDKVLSAYASGKELMVFSHFQRLVTQRRPESVSYLMNGQEHHFSLAEAPKNHILLQQQPYLFRKLMRFRSISKVDPQPCAH